MKFIHISLILSFFFAPIFSIGAAAIFDPNELTIVQIRNIRRGRKLHGVSHGDCIRGACTKLLRVVNAEDDFGDDVAKMEVHSLLSRLALRASEKTREENISLPSQRGLYGFCSKVIRMLHEFRRDLWNSAKGFFKLQEARIFLKLMDFYGEEHKHYIVWRRDAYSLFEWVWNNNHNKYPLVFQAKLIIEDNYLPEGKSQKEAYDLAESLLDTFGESTPGRQPSFVQRVRRRLKRKRAVDQRGLDAAEIQQGAEFTLEIHRKKQAEDLAADLRQQLINERARLHKVEQGEAVEKEEAAMVPELGRGDEDLPADGLRYPVAARDYQEPTPTDRIFRVGGLRLRYMQTSVHENNCWAYALGLSRAQASNQLLEHEDDDIIRTLVGSQIHAAFMRQDAAQLPQEILNHEGIRKVYAELRAEEERCRAAAVPINNHNETHEALCARLQGGRPDHVTQEEYDNFMGAYTSHQAKEEEFRVLFNALDIYRTFVRRFVAIPGRAMEFQYTAGGGVPTVLDALARIGNFGLEVYMEEGGSLVRRHVVQVAGAGAGAGGEVRRVHYASGQGIGHFSRLDVVNVGEEVVLSSEDDSDDEILLHRRGAVASARRAAVIVDGGEVVLCSEDDSDDEILLRRRGAVASARRAAVIADGGEVVLSSEDDSDDEILLRHRGAVASARRAAVVADGGEVVLSSEDDSDDEILLRRRGAVASARRAAVIADGGEVVLSSEDDSNDESMGSGSSGVRLPGGRTVYPKSPRDRGLLQRYCDGMNQGVMAAEYEITQSRVSQILQSYGISMALSEEQREVRRDRIRKFAEDHPNMGSKAAYIAYQEEVEDAAGRRVFEKIYATSRRKLGFSRKQLTPAQIKERNGEIVRLRDEENQRFETIAKILSGRFSITLSAGRCADVYKEMQVQPRTFLADRQALGEGVGKSLSEKAKDEKVREYYKTHPPEEIAAYLGKTPYRVKAKIATIQRQEKREKKFSSLAADWGVYQEECLRTGRKQSLRQFVEDRNQRLGARKDLKVGYKMAYNYLIKKGLFEARTYVYLEEERNNIVKWVRARLAGGEFVTDSEEEIATRFGTTVSQVRKALRGAGIFRSRRTGALDDKSGKAPHHGKKQRR